MLKENKGTIILTTLITAAPVLLGLLLWSRLPETIATHPQRNGASRGGRAAGRPRNRTMQRMCSA